MPVTREGFCVALSARMSVTISLPMAQERTALSLIYAGHYLYFYFDGFNTQRHNSPAQVIMTSIYLPDFWSGRRLGLNWSRVLSSNHHVINQLSSFSGF